MDRTDEEWAQFIQQSDETRSFPTDESNASDDEPVIPRAPSPKKSRGRPRKQSPGPSHSIGEGEIGLVAPPPSPKITKKQKDTKKDEEVQFQKLAEKFRRYKKDPVISKFITDIEFQDKEGMIALQEKLLCVKQRLAQRFTEDMTKNMFFKFLDVTEDMMVKYLQQNALQGCANDLKTHPDLWEVEVAEIGIDLFGGMAPSPYVRLGMTCFGFAVQYQDTQKKLNQEKNKMEDLEY